MAGKTLILGLGNTILSDDGFGPKVADLLRDLVQAGSGVEVETASVGGFLVLDMIQGYERVLIIDIAVTGEHPPGSLRFWQPEREREPWTLGGSHQMDLATVLELGSQLGFPMPWDIAVLVAEARDVETMGTDLSPEMEDAIPHAVRMILDWADPEHASLRSDGEGRSKR
jgi:hydrogenase maturation protease